MKSEDRYLWIWIVVPAVVVVATVVLLALLREGEQGGPEAGVALDEIAEEPDRFSGETVTVEGGVGEVLGARSFLITERFAASDLLVISSVPLWKVEDHTYSGSLPNTDLSEEQLIQVTGEVVRFDIAGAERRIGADLGEETLDAYSGTPAIIADSISLRLPDAAEVVARGASDEG